MTTAPPEGILEKVRVLLRLASDEAATEHEASLAMERLQAMLLRYNLDMADAECEEGAEPCPVLNEMFDVGAVQWKRFLLSAIARHNFCRTVISNGQSHILGRKHNVEAVKEMASWLTGQLEILASTQAGVQEFLGRPVNSAWKGSFLLGAINRIGERLQELELGQDANTRALVVNLTEETNTFMHQEYPDLRRGRTVNVQPEAYHAGVNAGNIVSVLPSSRQVEG